jgi:hypothetical protein
VTHKNQENQASQFLWAPHKHCNNPDFWFLLATHQNWSQLLWLADIGGRLVGMRIINNWLIVMWHPIAIFWPLASFHKFCKFSWTCFKKKQKEHVVSSLHQYCSTKIIRLAQSLQVKSVWHFIVYFVHVCPCECVSCSTYNASFGLIEIIPLVTHETTGHFDILTVINHEALAWFWHFNLQHPLCLCQMQMMLGREEQPSGEWISVSQVRPDMTRERGTVEYKVAV